MNSNNETSEWINNTSERKELIIPIDYLKFLPLDYCRMIGYGM